VSRRFSLSVPGRARRAHQRWLVAPALVAVASAAVLAGCGGSSASSGQHAAGDRSGSAHSCTASKHGAGVVVQPSKTRTVKRCVGFDGKTIPAVTLVQRSGVEVQFKDFGGKLGKSVCQAAHVPAHYTKCLPAGKPYWAVFIARGGKSWAAPPVGLSSITLHPGDSLGLRYDSPKGKPAPPSVSPPTTGRG
jgi:hypothetical protein